MEQDTRLFVVIAVLVVILLGIGLFLFYLERRLKNSEKQMAQLEGKKNKGKENS